MAQYGAIVSSKNSWDFDPRTVGSCTLWLDSADTNFITLSGSNVTTWKDKSGKGYNATQATVANQPTWTDTVSGIRFNPTNSGATVNTTQYLSNTSVSISLASHTIFVVQSQGSASTNTPRCFAIGQSAADYQASGLLFGNLFSPYTACQVYGLNAGFYSGTFTSTTPWPKGIYCNVFDFTTSIRQMYLTGSNVANPGANANNFTSASTYYYLGCGYNSTVTGYYNGTIFEVLIYTSNLSLAQRQTVEGYLAWKWSLQANLPASHPFSSSVGRITRPFVRQFNPVDIVGCVLWLDASDGSTITISSGTSVSQWNDKSGNVDHATQASASLQPTYANSAVTFNGSSQYLTLSTPSTLPNGGTPTGTYFFVSKLTTGSAVQALFMYGPTTLATGANPQFYYNSSNQLAIDTFGAGGTTDATNVLNTTIVFSSTIYNTGTTGTVTGWRNSNLFGPTTYTTASITSQKGFIGVTQIGVGTSGTLQYYFTGNIYEIIVYNSVLTNAQRQQVEAYLGWKWGVRSSFSSTFPLYSVPTNSSVFTPKLISGCVLWLDGMDISTLFQDTAGTTPITTNGQTVALWKDKSGSTDNGTQSTAGNRPTYSSNSVVFSSASSQYLTMSTPSTLPSGATPTGTYFFISKLTTGTNLQALFMYGPTTLTTGANFQFYYNTPSSQLTIDTFSTGVTSDSTNALNATVIFSSTISNSGGTGTITGWRNSNSFGPITYTTASMTSQKGFIGVTQTGRGTSGTNAYYFNGNIYEIIFYNTVLSTSQRQQVEGYLAWKWGLNANLPTTHPYYKIIP